MKISHKKPRTDTTNPKSVIQVVKLAISKVAGTEIQPINAPMEFTNIKLKIWNKFWAFNKKISHISNKDNHREQYSFCRRNFNRFFKITKKFMLWFKKLRYEFRD